MDGLIQMLEGTGFSLFPERLMRDLPEIRYGLIGEAELTLPRLLAQSPFGVGGLSRGERENKDHRSFPRF